MAKHLGLGDSQSQPGPAKQQPWFTENMARIPLTNLFLKCLQIMAESQLPTKNTEKIR